MFPASFNGRFDGKLQSWASPATSVSDDATVLKSVQKTFSNIFVRGGGGGGQAICGNFHIFGVFFIFEVFPNRLLLCLQLIGPTSNNISFSADHH